MEEHVAHAEGEQHARAGVGHHPAEHGELGAMVWLAPLAHQLQEAAAAKIAKDDAKACVSMQVVAATASEFEDFVAAEATTSEVMAIMKRGRVMRLVADMRGMAEDTVDGCGSEA